MQNGSKKCSICTKLLKIKMFNVDSSHVDGHRSECKTCQQAKRSNVTARYSTGRKNATTRGLSFSISLEQYKLFCVNNLKCYYCDIDMTEGNKSGLGLNRIDHNLGYTIQNVQRCCTKCNTIMSNFTKEDLLSRVYKIIKRMK